MTIYRVVATDSAIQKLKAQAGFDTLVSKWNRKKRLQRKKLKQIALSWTDIYLQGPRSR